MQVIGQAPPALAPFAADDPISGLQLQPHPEQRTARQAAESFLAHLTRGYDGSRRLAMGSIIGADPLGYEKAWALMVPERPTQEQFLQQWQGTATIKVIQLEEADQNRFFVELQRLVWCDDHWAVSFYTGFLTTVQTDAGWRIKELRVEPEELVGINVAGHQGWQHNPVMVTDLYLRTGDEAGLWEGKRIEYRGRTATLTVRSRKTVAIRVVKLARTVEGRWIPLSGFPPSGK